MTQFSRNLIEKLATANTAPGADKILMNALIEIEDRLAKLESATKDEPHTN